jgi:hypothetical protein
MSAILSCLPAVLHLESSAVWGSVVHPPLVARQVAHKHSLVYTQVPLTVVLPAFGCVCAGEGWGYGWFFSAPFMDNCCCQQFWTFALLIGEPLFLCGNLCRLVRIATCRYRLLDFQQGIL